MLFSLLAVSLTGAQALRSKSQAPLLAVAGSPTVFSADNQVNPDNKAWKGGSEQLLTWKFEGAVPKVNILLYRPEGLSGDRFVEGLAFDVKNTGSHVVTVPTGLVPGKYFLQVESGSDSRVSAFSPTFTIDESATPPKITDVALGFLPFR